MKKFHLWAAVMAVGVWAGGDAAMAQRPDGEDRPEAGERDREGAERGDHNEGERGDRERGDADRGDRGERGRDGERGQGDRGPGGFDAGRMLRGMPVIAALDADANGEISTEELDGAAAALKKLDKNSDGKVDTAEMMPEFRGFGGGPGGPGGGGPGAPGGGGRGGDPTAMVDRLMSNDKDSDGKLSKEEIPERMQAVLTRADKDNDGFATKEELTAMATAEAAAAGPGGGERGGPGGGPGGPGGGRGGFGNFDPQAMVDGMFERYDTNKDGNLSREEMKAFQFGRGGDGGRGPDGGRDRPDGDRPEGGNRPEGDRPDRPRRPE